jgi:PAS domain S-box-containing protein
MTADTEFTAMRRGMDLLGMAVLWADPEDGKIVYANQASLKLLACSRQELLTYSLPDIDIACREGGWPEIVAELRGSGAVERETNLLIGSEHPLSVELNSSIVEIDGEEVVIYFVRAVGESSGAVKAADAQLALITDSLPILIARVDRDLHYTFVNKRYERLFGRDRSELVGSPLKDVLGAGDMAGLRPFIKRVLLGETVTFERALYKTSLGKRKIRETYSPDFSEDGRIAGYFILGQDITAEADIREARAEKAKSQLLDAIESLSAGFALFDRDDRLVVCNTKFRSAFLVIATHIKRGAKFEDIVRRYAETVES